MDEDEKKDYVLIVEEKNWRTYYGRREEKEKNEEKNVDSIYVNYNL